MLRLSRRPAPLSTPILTLLALLTASCGGDSGSPSGPPDPVPTTLTISGYAGPLTHLGATIQLSASVLDQNGSAMGGQGVDWSTSDAEAATVSGSGLVTAAGPGTATITARVGSASDGVQVEVDPAPSAAVVVSGEAQAGAVGQPLSEEVVVELRDAGGHPLEGESVSFTVASGEGSVSPASATTDAEGRASALWTLGTRTDVEQRLRVQSGDVSTDVTAEPMADEPVAFEAHAGLGQSGLAGEALPEDVAVRIADQYDNGVPDVTVTWSVAPEHGSFESASTLTDQNGVASTTWLLEAHAGEKLATASAEGLTEVEFAATALPNGVIQGTASRVSGFLTTPAQPVAEAGQASPKLASPLAPGGSQSAPSPPSDRPEFVEGELIVKFRTAAVQAAGGMAATPQSVAAAEVQEQALATRARGLETASRYEVMRATGVLRTVRVKVRSGESVEDVAAALQADPAVEWVERNRWVYQAEQTRSMLPSSRARAASSGDDVEATWPMVSSTERVTSGASTEPLYPWQAWHYEMLDLPQAWKITRGDPSIIVAVVDDGIRFDHPDIAGNLTSDGYDFVSDVPAYVDCATAEIRGQAGDGDGRDSDPTVPFKVAEHPVLSCHTPKDLFGHGLHVAGTIAALENGLGGVGVAPGVRIRPVRVLGVSGGGTTADIAAGIAYAAGFAVDGQQASGPAHVINLSLGGPNLSTMEQDAVELAHQAGSLVIAAAGNDETSAPRYPAAFPEALAVSAVGPGAYFADSYSNWGSHIEVTAPGGDRWGTGGGDQRWGVVSSRWSLASGSATAEGIDGTSMAAPHVSGVAALLFSQDPSRTNDEVRALLTGYTVDLEPAGIDVYHGHGLVNALGALTQGQGIPGEIRVQLHDAETGALVAEQAAPGGQFRFEGLPDGEYEVYAGVDEFSDGVVGVSPRPWGALGGSAKPSAIVIDGAGERDASFQFGFPAEGANDTPEQADRLPVDGYLNASLASGSDNDYYRVRIAEAGTYTFETAGFRSACGFPGGADTVLELLDAQGTPIATNDDIDTDASLHCSRITTSLSPGTYVLRVTAWGQLDLAVGLYRIVARSG